MEDDADTSNWRSVATLIIFFLTTITVNFPFNIPVPSVWGSFAHSLAVECRIVSSELSNKHHHRHRIPCNFLTLPLLAVLLLLALGAIDGVVIQRGIVGADGVHPLDIMALFISLAYISISLDATGLFRFLAFWVAQKGGTSGPRLHFFFYVLFLVCGVIVGNDPVILSGTAFLAYFTRISGITPPTAWMFSQFTAVNIASAVLVSSNPTNLVLAGAFSLTFLTYTSSLILPVLAAALVAYPFLVFVVFRRPRELIPRTIEHGAEVLGDPRAALVDAHGAVFGGVLLLVTLGVLVGTSVIGVPVWEITIPPALIMLARDALHDWRRHHTGHPMESASTQPTPGSSNPQEAVPADDGPIELQMLPDDDVPKSAERVHPGPRASLASILAPRYKRLARAFPTVHIVMQRLPGPLIPFAFAMFILVQGLAAQGWIRVFAGWWAAWVRATGLLGAIAGMAAISGLLCNVCGTNIGTTILLARMLQLWDPPNARVRYGAVYALALGANYGAFSGAFAASLAGLLWRDILRQKGIHVRQRQFARVNAGTWAVATAASASVLVAQAIVIHRS